MPSFEEILNRPSTENKAPPAYPAGTYHCLIDGRATPGKSSQKGTDLLQFKFKILAPKEDVDAQQAAEQQIVGKIITADYYITDGAAYRCQEMLEHAGCNPEGSNLKRMLDEAPGKQLLVKLKHSVSQDGKRTFHQVESTAAV